MHGARAALSVVAALLRSGERHPLAQSVEQRHAWIELETPCNAIHFELYVEHVDRRRRLEYVDGCRARGARLCRQGDPSSYAQQRGDELATLERKLAVVVDGFA